MPLRWPFPKGCLCVSLSMHLPPARPPGLNQRPAPGPTAHRRAAAQLQHGSAFALPRPLLRAMQKSMWADGGGTTAAELSTAALRAAPFLKTPAADLARGILDAGGHAAVSDGACAWDKRCESSSSLHKALTAARRTPQPAAVHWAAELVAADSKAVTGLGAVLSLAPHASRTDATQRELQQLRLVSSEGGSFLVVCLCGAPHRRACLPACRHCAHLA